MVSFEYANCWYKAIQTLWCELSGMAVVALKIYFFLCFYAFRECLGLYAEHLVYHSICLIVYNVLLYVLCIHILSTHFEFIFSAKYISLEQYNLFGCQLNLITLQELKYNTLGQHHIFASLQLHTVVNLTHLQKYIMI